MHLSELWSVLKDFCGKSVKLIFAFLQKIKKNHWKASQTFIASLIVDFKYFRSV